MLEYVHNKVDVDYILVLLLPHLLDFTNYITVLGTCKIKLKSASSVHISIQYILFKRYEGHFYLSYF